MLRPFETIDGALVAAGVTHVQVAGTMMRAVAAEVQWARLSALLEDLRLRRLCRLLPRCWSLLSRGLGFGFPRRLLLLRHVVSLLSSLLEMLSNPSGMFGKFRRCVTQPHPLEYLAVAADDGWLHTSERVFGVSHQGSVSGPCVCPKSNRDTASSSPLSETGFATACERRNRTTKKPRSCHACQRRRPLAQAIQRLSC